AGSDYAAAQVAAHAAAPAFADAVPALRRLRALGLRTAILSNADRDELDQHLDRFGPHVDAFVWSEEVGADKPDTAAFVAACDRLGVVPAEAVMVGDQPADDI